LIEKLEADKTFGENAKAKLVFEEFRKLAAYTKETGAYENIILDLSLARGLDYYTGMIFEVVINGFAVGSLGGGEYSFSTCFNFPRWKIRWSPWHVLQ
jgi:histidyl-tRNA synthetase